MIDDETRAKVAKLPTWARDLIKRLEYMNESLVEEATRQRRAAARERERASRLGAANEALMELLRDAGIGGNDWAARVVSVLEGYEIFREAATADAG